MKVFGFVGFLRRGRRSLTSPRSTPEEPALDEGCNLGAHRRLLDAHLLWHQAALAYEDAAAFRANLNACIEQLRSVTLVLQAEKRKIKDFDAWYEPWRQRLKQDPVSSWLNTARVQVFHVADLAAGSRARISLLVSPAGSEVATEFDLPPDTPLAGIVDEIRRRVRGIGVQYGVAIVERRWVASDLPDHELLDALAICYRQLDELVVSAHTRLVVGAREISKSRPECLSHAADARTVRIDLATATTMSYESYEVVLTPDLQRRALKRYGPHAASGSGATAGTRELAVKFADFAKRVLARDGQHMPTLIILLPGGGSLLQQMVFTDASDKLLLWQRAAVEVERVEAPGLIFIGEAWVRSPEDGRIVGEVLNVTLAEEDGSITTWSTPFKHRLGRIRLGATRQFDNERALYLEPVLRVWRERRARNPKA